MSEGQATDEQRDLDLDPETVQDLEVDDESADDVPGGLSRGCGGGGGGPQLSVSCQQTYCHCQP